MSELLCSYDKRIFVKVIHPDIEALYKKQRKNSWPESDVNFATDELNWPKIDRATQNYICHILSFSLVSDSLVNDNLLVNLMRDINEPSAMAFLAEQYSNEIVHQRTYSIMLSKIERDPERVNRLRHPEENYPGIAAKIGWINKFIQEDCSLARRLTGNALLEGISFSSLFGGFYYIKHRALGLDGLVQANELIAGDEMLHCIFSLTLLKYVSEPLLREEVVEMVRSIVDVELAFVHESIPQPMESGLDADVMTRYVKHIANRVCRVLLVKPTVGQDYEFCNNIYSDNEIGDLPDWLVRNQGIDNFTLFFDRQPTEYQQVEGEFELDSESE